MKRLLPLFIFVCVASAPGQTQPRKPTTEKKPVVTVKQSPKPLTEAEICSLCVSAHYDKVADKTTYAGRPIAVTPDGKEGFLIRTFRFPSDSISINIKLGGVSPCIDKHTSIELLFRDGTRLATRSGSDSFDCEGHVPIYFRGVFGNEDLLKMLQTKSIETMRIHTFKSFLQEDFSQSQSTELMNQLKCLDKESRSEAGGSQPVPRVVSGGVLNGEAISLPMPEYPPAARAVKAAGSVSVQVLVDEYGKVIAAAAVSGHPLLRSSAESAAKEARFSPALVNGVPVKVSGVITYSFKP